MYRTISQLDSLTSLLSTWFPQFFTRLTLPENSVQGRPVYALRMRAGDGGERRGVLIVGGTHSRELMNPDAIIELAVDLLVSYVLNRDIVYGGRTWSANEIRIILETLDLWILPCSNPDGRNYVMTVDGMWRKNLRDNPNTTCDGVDLNRNLDILWGVTQGQTSCSPCSDVYVGPSAFSEPETRNVKNILDTRRIDCFVDVHSYSELVLYPWGHAPTQTADPTKRFTGLPSGTCAPIGQPGYQEYMPPQDLLRFQTVGKRVVDAIAAVRGRVYTLEPGIALYPTTGTQSDYAYSRHIADSKLRKTYGFTFETGPWAGNAPDSFHPADPTLIKRDIKSGILALVQQCICAIELIGSRLLKRETEVSTLRSVRDDLLGTTGPGREWIALFERAQTPLVGMVLEDQRLADAAASLVERIGSFIQAEESTISDDDVELGTSVIRELLERSESREVRADLQAAATRLREMVGLRSREAIERLMHRGPHRGYESDDESGA
jgi:murein tripeptide amidase MpaA